jgi:hypothetical protein
MLKGERLMTTSKNENMKSEIPAAVSMDHIKGCVNHVLTEFTNQELGNRISQFNMQGLANILVGVIANPDSLKKPEQSEPKEKK